MKHASEVFGARAFKRAIATVRGLAAAGLGPGGPSVMSVVSSVRHAMTLTLAAWNVILAGVVLVASPRVPALPVVILHLALAGLCFLVLRGFLRFDVFLVLAYGTWMVDYLVARSVNDALTLAACWLGDLLYVASALALRNRARTWLPTLGSIGVVAVIVTASPIWDFKTASAFIVTAFAIVIVARVAMPGLWRLAETADNNADTLEAERRAETLVRRTSAEAAEDARVLHDTVINTLGAVANSGRQIPMIDAMRSRCLRDLTVVEGLLQGRRRHRQDLARIGANNGTVRIDRTGLSDADLDELGDLLTPDAVSAVVGAVDEAVRNVGKHSGADAATIDINRSEGGVHIHVIDHGVGFDPDAEVSGHGLAESVRGRMRAVGGSVAVMSEIGRGTELVISLPLRTAGPDSLAYGPVTDAGRIAQQLIRRACWLLSVGIVAVGILIELSNRPGELTWTYAMLGIVSACIALAFVAARRSNTLPEPVAALLALALPAGFVADMAGIDFGRVHVMTYQAIGIVPIMVILLSLAHRWWALLAGSGLVVAAVTTATLMWLKSADLGVIVVVGLLPALGLSLGWWAFERLVLQVIEESERSRWKAFVASVDAAVQIEVAQARQRWGTASLERAATLLKGIGESEIDPADASIQQACAVEERYLRQFLLLSPRSYRMSVWFAHALAAARSRDIQLVIRSGDLDAPDGASAETIGAMVLEAVERTPQGGDLTVSWFPTHAGPRLSIVGAAAPSDSTRSDPRVPQSWTVVREVLLDHEMLEVIVA